MIVGVIWDAVDTTHLFVIPTWLAHLTNLLVVWQFCQLSFALQHIWLMY